MIDKYSCLILLNDIKEKGINVDKQIKLITTSKSNQIPLEVLKFINSHKSLDAVNFYERIRDNYNKKRSNLYINIVGGVKDPQEVLTTLAALNLQILLYSKHVENKSQFFAHLRATEIIKVLDNYYKTFDLTNCLNLLKLIKADLCVLENINGRRQQKCYF